MSDSAARVIVLAGPSGAGKSRLAVRLGLPVLHLDDFYRDGSDPALPRIGSGPNAGIVDWDDPRSWMAAEAVGTLERLCRTGRAAVPIYDIAHDGRTGSRVLDLGTRDRFVAEGIFAAEVVVACREAGMLDSAWCVRQHPGLTFVRRLARDLREHRKPPLVLLRRGLALARAQRSVVDRAVAAGCRPAAGDEAYAAIRARMAPMTLVASGDAWPVPDGFRQPDATTCGPTALVVARMLLSPSYAAEVGSAGAFREAVLALHRRLTRPVAPGGGMQLPWPQALGTPPWAVAAELTSLSPAASYRSRAVRLGRGAFRRAVDAVRAGRPVAVFVGNTISPRHVVLLTGLDEQGVGLYDPADGRRHLLAEDDVTAGRLPRLSGWDTPWFVVSP